MLFPNLLEDLFVTVRPMADEFGSELSLEAGELVALRVPSAGGGAVSGLVA